METINIIFDFDQSKKIYERYFDFERKKQLQKIPFKILLASFGVIILIGILTKLDLIWILGLILISILFIYWFYFFVQFQIALNNWLKKLKKNPPPNFEYSFDSETISYKSENINSSIKWTAYKSYEINGMDAYLYDKQGKLIDICSSEIMGEEKFEKFKKILSSRVQKN